MVRSVSRGRDRRRSRDRRSRDRDRRRSRSRRRRRSRSPADTSRPRNGKRRRTAWDTSAPPPPLAGSIPGVGVHLSTTPAELTTLPPALGLAPDVVEIIDKFAFFIAREGDHLEDMTRSRRRDEAKLRWLQDRSSPEYRYYKTKVKDLRDKLQYLRDEAATAGAAATPTPLLVPPPGAPSLESTLKQKEINTLSGLARLDAMYTQREQQERVNNPQPEPAEVSEEVQEDLADGHHLQDFIPEDVLTDFQRKCQSVLGQQEPPAVTAQAPTNPAFPPVPTPPPSGPPPAMPTSSSQPPPSSAARPGLGASSTENPTMDPKDGDDIYAMYKKRMMLAYKYRPNPLGNPRTPYY